MKIVYFIEHPGAPEGFRWVKIGKTCERRGPRERLAQLQTGTPHRLTLLGWLSTDEHGVEGLEGFWHRKLVEARKDGEWFLLDSRAVADLARRFDDVENDRRRRVRDAIDRSYRLRIGDDSTSRK